ncbi:MAG: winged helix-turn-helix transcriptional regulator [Rhodoferax sp.]|nr:winged helix-turn-helix transcriptional regulator [Rhodoferax sp.]MBK9236403.1 winged helix-turn-helix transcriptional regulator [Rhodoferax sp.]
METSPPSGADQEAAVVKALAALAQAQRLRAFRALVVAGAQGLTPSAMAAQLGTSPSTLSFHLKELLNSYLITCEARGRHLIYRASFAHTAALLAYLTQHCCQGATDGTPEAARCEGC